MNDLIENMLSAVGPEISEKVRSQFGLSADVSEKVLPGVAELVTDTLAGRGEEADAGDLISTLTNLVEQDGAEQSDSLLEQFFGTGLSSAISGFAEKLGVDGDTSRGILQAVVPQVLSYFTESAGKEGLSGLLSLMGGRGGDIAEDLLKSAGGAQGLLGKLGGFFRKG